VSQQLERRSAPMVFRVASFNVLGDSHTGPGGNKVGFPDGSARMDMAIATLRNNGVDVVGFQEFEQSQFAMFSARAGEYSLYPGMALGNKSVRFNIAWRSSMWRMVDAHTLSIPYAGGSRIEMPVVLLESTTNGRRAWFANFHNPADTPSLGNNGRWRAEAASIEISHLSSLHAQDGLPVIVTGDFNERSEIFCRFTAGGVFSAAAGGSSGAGCAPPPSMQVDWIFGSSGVAFDGYSVTDTGRASDHAMVHAQATLTEVE
jgi:endonuclease/exonuclease/phosphatase family metal-dependent hydrolase